MKPARNAFARDAIAAKGWWSAHRWLLLRRSVQLGVLALFLAGPWLGWWVVKGNLNYSLTLDTLPLADPLVMLQSLLTGHVPERNAIIGVAIVLAFYLLVGGRVYCAWVCPVNIVTDAASALRRRLDIRGGGDLPRQTRYWMLALILALLIPAGAFAKPIPIKVVVLTTFETGASSAKTSGEFQAWAARYPLTKESGDALDAFKDDACLPATTIKTLKTKLAAKNAAPLSLTELVVSADKPMRWRAAPSTQVSVDKPAADAIVAFCGADAKTAGQPRVSGKIEDEGGSELRVIVIGPGQ